MKNKNKKAVLNGKFSNTVHLNSGVPQGSMLRPLFFFILPKLSLKCIALLNYRRLVDIYI